MAEFNQFGAGEDENAEIKKLELEVVRALEYIHLVYFTCPRARNLEFRVLRLGLRVSGFEFRYAASVGFIANHERAHERAMCLYAVSR